MNMNMLTRMFTRLIMRRAMNWGIDKGLSTFSKARKPRQASLPPQIDDDGNPVQVQNRQGGAQNRKQARDVAKKLRTVNRMTRR